MTADATLPAHDQAAAPQYRRLDRREMAAAHGVRSGDRLDTLPGHERVTRTHEELCARAWGITLPPAPTSLEAPRSNGPQIRDFIGRITIAEMKPLFEDTMRGFRGLASRVALDPAYLPGETGYYNTDTNLMWIGFALGMRCAERRERERESGREGDAASSQRPDEAGMLPTKPL